MRVRRIDEPGIDVAGGALRGVRVVQQIGGGAQGKDGIGHGNQRVLVGDEAVGVGLAVAADIRGFGVAVLGPPVGGLAVEIVDVHGDALGALVGDAPGALFGPALGVGAQAADGIERPCFLADDGGVQGFGFGVGNEGHGNARGMGTRHQRYHEDGAFHYHRL